MTKQSDEEQDLLRRLSAFAAASRDPIPDSPAVLRVIVDALLDRISQKDRRAGTWCRLIVQGLAARDRYQQDCLVLSRPEACPELEELRSGKPHDPTHLPELLRFQNAWIKQFLKEKNIAGKNRSPSQWAKSERRHIFETISSYRCLCTYRKSFDDLQLGDNLSEPVVRLELLAFLHKIKDIDTIESMLRPSRSDLNAPPPRYLR